MNFLIYNFFFMLIYYLIDYIFDFFNFYTKEFYTNQNFYLIILNMFLTYIILIYLKKKYIEWENN